MSLQWDWSWRLKSREEGLTSVVSVVGWGGLLGGGGWCWVVPV